MVWDGCLIDVDPGRLVEGVADGIQVGHPNDEPGHLPTFGSHGTPLSKGCGTVVGSEAQLEPSGVAPKTASTQVFGPNWAPFLGTGFGSGFGGL